MTRSALAFISQRLNKGQHTRWRPSSSAFARTCSSGTASRLRKTHSPFDTSRRRCDTSSAVKSKKAIDKLKASSRPQQDDGHTPRT